VVKRPRPEVNHSPPPSYELKNERSYTSTPPLWLHGMDKENLNFYLLLYDIMMSCVCVCGWGGGYLFIPFDSVSEKSLDTLRVNLEFE